MTTGLNGFFGSKLFKALVGVVAVAVAGPIGGGIISMIYDRAASHWGWRGNNPYVEGVLDDWMNAVFTPYYKSFMAKVSTIKRINSANIAKYNSMIEELYAWKAYYEFVAIKETDEDEILIAQEKADFIGEYIEIAKESWLQNFPHQSSGYNFYETTFNPLVYTHGGTEKLNWNGVKHLTASKNALAEKPFSNGGNTGGNTGGGTISTGGNTGGNNSGGGFAVTAPPKTGGGTIHTGGGNTSTGSNTGGGTINTGSNNTGGGTINTGSGNTTTGSNPGGGTINTGSSNTSTGGNTGGGTINPGNNTPSTGPSDKKYNKLIFAGAALALIAILKK